MDPLVDPRCLVTTDAVLVDGTNGVCHGNRMNAGDPLDAGALGVLLLALVSLAWFVGRARPSRPRTIALAATLVLAALPGATALLFVRADRPRNARRAAREIAAFHDSLRSWATEHGCAEVVRTECTACEPLAILALVDRRCDAPAPIELRGDSLAAGCAEEAGGLVCGAVDFGRIPGGPPP